VVNLDGHPRLVGQFVDVIITETLSHSLRGRLAGGRDLASAVARTA
jgi:tRNA-2-methylthio-N6-dimethylallyladenosine synthase